MNIALIGFGAMGKRVKEFARKQGHKVVSVIDPQANGATAKKITKDSLNLVDVAIDFSHPTAVVDNINAVISAKINLVVGTTGWYDHLDEIKKKVESAGIGFLWSSNFSIGVNVYFKIVEAAAKFINQFDEYDVWGHEIHHNGKIDSPSGTAKNLEKIILENIDKKTEIVEETLHRKIKSHEMHFSSTRAGEVNFSHTIGFDSASDSIKIIHEARNRDAYALGAVRAAQWLSGKTGFFNMDNFLNL